jgi:DNA replication and repair protein RecF
MWVQTRSFRNLAGSRLNFGEPVTLLWGENAQGKTNLLEAVSVLGTGRSFREKRLGALVREGEESAAVSGAVRAGGVSHDLEVVVRQGHREVFRDGAPSTLPEHVRVLPIVSLSSEDRALVRGEPKTRREFLDGTAVLAHPAFLRDYQEFHRALRQRNEVLRGYVPSRRGELDAWTRAYAGLANEVRRTRAETAERIAQGLRVLEKEMEQPERVELRYVPEREGLQDLLEKGRPEEIRRGHTLFGPHRDGVEILLRGRPASAFGSSGQVRTVLWMLKLVRVLLIRERDPAPPVFLLDDAGSELDARRIREMMRLTNGKAQVLLTSTESLGPSWGEMGRVRVRGGSLDPSPMEM